MLSKRLNEFVNYHNTGDGECNGVILKNWADRHNLDKHSRIDLCYYYEVNRTVS